MKKDNVLIVIVCTVSFLACAWLVIMPLLRPLFYLGYVGEISSFDNRIEFDYPLEQKLLDSLADEKLLNIYTTTYSDSLKNYITIEFYFKEEPVEKYDVRFFQQNKQYITVIKPWIYPTTTTKLDSIWVARNGDTTWVTQTWDEIFFEKWRIRDRARKSIDKAIEELRTIHKK